MGVRTAVIVTLTLALGCHEDNAAPADGFALRLQIVDETNEPVPQATVRALGQSLTCDKNGQVELRLRRPAVVRVSGTGFLEEVALFGWESDGSQQTVRLLASKGGRRIVLHFGGDVMFGRRYLDPTEGEPLLELGDEAAGAKAVVSDLAEAFSAADLGVVNLETVVGRLADSLAYPGKRFLLQSPPDSLAALPYMGVDVVSLANNHTRDWLEPGLEDTLFAIDAAGLERVGAGLTEAEAHEPLVVQVGQTRVCILAYTALTGSSVNDALPDPDDTPPSDLAADRQWMYELRSWGIDIDDWHVPVAARRPGEAWSFFDEAESSLDAPSRATAWTSLSSVYPELQDLVARRGHGGAALWSNKTSPTEVAQLDESCDTTILLLHAGDELSHIVADDVRNAAFAAIEAGASLVVAHHPHVLQGMEWHDGGLFVHSLGNLVFDQTLFATFDSAVLRVVLEDGNLLEARFLPLTISAFRPLPVVDDAASRIWLHQMENSVSSWNSYRDPKTDKVVVLASDIEPPSTGLRREWGTARITTEPLFANRNLELEAQEPIVLDADALWPAKLGLPNDRLTGVMIGRDLVGYGSFKAVTATDQPPRALHWDLDSEDESVLVEPVPGGRSYLRLFRDDENKSVLLTRPIARVQLPRHRLYGPDEDGGIVPLDPIASYSLVLTGRLTGNASATLRIDFSGFENTDLTASPDSQSLGRIELPLKTLGADWTRLDVPFELPEGKEALVNMAMLYVMIEPPAAGEATLDIDDIAFVEWRAADEMPGIWGAFTHVWSPQSLSVPTQVLPIVDSLK